MPTPLLLVQNAGAIDGTTYADPSVVADGKLAAFADGGAAKALNAAISGKFQVVEGGDTPVRTLLIDASKMTVVKKAFEAPVKSKFTFSSIPVGPSGGETYMVAVIDVSKAGEEPDYIYRSEIDVPASQAAAVSINALADALNAKNGRPYVARSNKVDTLTLTGTSGTATVTIEGIDYTATFATSLTVTATNFVSAHASAIKSNHGITLTSSGADLIFTAAVGSFDSPTIANATGDLDGTVANTQASTQLVIEALEFGTILRIAKDFGAATAPTVAETAYKQGSGTEEQMKDLEQLSFALHGDIAREVAHPLTPESRIIDGGQYTLYEITLPGDNYDSVNPGVYPFIVIAVEDSVTGNLDTFLGV